MNVFDKLFHFQKSINRELILKILWLKNEFKEERYCI